MSTIPLYSLHLSKSLFIRGLQCHKSLYLDRYHPELRTAASVSQERVFQFGHDVGSLAHDLFPGGIEIPHEELTHEEKIQKTAAEIRDGTKTLYEATFSHDDVLVKADILNRVENGWNLYEVKASTGLKEVYLNDIAVQYYVIAGSGLPLSRAFLVHINNRYVRKGSIDVTQLFVFEDVTEAVKARQASVVEALGVMRRALKGTLPEIDIGPHCNDPYPCDFIDHCWKHIPEYSVFDLKGSTAKLFDLYNRGLVRLEDIPPDMVSGSRRMVLEAFLHKKEFANGERIGDFLDSLWYPLYFLDFETFAVPVPPCDGTRPYQHVPYQYSLHYLVNEQAELCHREFLAEPNIDPRRELAERLVAEIPDNACILAFNAPYEARILQELAEYLPEYAEKIEKMCNNIQDLAVPFRKKDVYHWRMMGSYSQKAVLPALVPDLSYEGLEVADGGMAMEAYFRMCGCRDPVELDKIRKDLLDYCRTDTLGMVKILEKLRSMCSAHGLAR